MPDADIVVNPGRNTSLLMLGLVSASMVVMVTLTLRVFYPIAESASAVEIYNPSAKIDDRREIVIFRVKNNIELREGFKEAALSSVLLPFIFEFRLEDPTRAGWFRAHVIAEDVQQIQLRYNTLLEQFVLSRELMSDPGIIYTENFPDLNSAMNFLLTANTYPLRLSTALPPEEAHDLVLKVRLRLDIDALPAPLQPYAYGNHAWGLDSDWVAWEVRV